MARQRSLPSVLLVGVLTFGATGCRAAEGTSSGPSGEVPPRDPVTSCDARPEAAAIAFTTSDGIVLEADLYPSGTVGGAAVVLLHMIPPANDKSNFPPAFISALHERGLTVLNVNRRGAGASGGNAEDAYEGDRGRLDAEAAHGFLTASACEVPADQIAFVGASNGSTTSLDHALAANDEDRPPALAFLSPGPYTENQNRIADHLDVLRDIPLLVAYPDSEAQWPNTVQSLGVGAWVFHEYPGGKHGTGLFSTHPDSLTTVADFIASHVSRP